MSASPHAPATEFGTNTGGLLIALGRFDPPFAHRLHKLGAQPAHNAAAARTMARMADVLVFAAGVVPSPVALSGTNRPRLVVVATSQTQAEALDALDEGADEIISDDLSDAALEDALFPRSRSKEPGGLHTPRLADLGAKMATIAHEIEALLHPTELRHVERTAQLAPIAAAPTAAQVRALIRGRRARSNYFPADLFADPAWDILLDLLAARLEGKEVSVSSLCIAAAVPPTTALRWIKTMTDAALLERKTDPADGRRIFIDLSDKAATAMEAYLARAAAMPGGLLAA